MMEKAANKEKKNNIKDGEQQSIYFNDKGIN